MKLAIKSHPERGKEVIQLLEMLGGRNTFNLVNTCKDSYYRISGIDIYGEQMLTDAKNTKVFTLEEFEEKYPYKVGDLVVVNNMACKVLSMQWSDTQNEVHYTIVNYQGIHTAEYLQSYKKQKTFPPYMDYDITETKGQEDMEEKDEKSANHVFDTEIISFDIAQRDKYELDLQGKFKVVLREGKYYVERIKPQYPKTYEECCEILNTRISNVTRPIGWKESLIAQLQELLICRDAYWKIAGEELGLGKPWEPDWSNATQRKYCIVNTEGNVQKWVQKTTNKILAFPTEEMRDAFYENFKDLIEQCKELL